MIDLAETSRKLSELSTKTYLNPYTYIEWPAVMPLNQWFMSKELLSVYGTDAFDNLNEAEQQRLSFFEAVNFFSLNIHGEKPLVEGLARRLYSKEMTEYSEYLHHFLDEENKHMIYFAGFCQRYAKKVYRDRKLLFPREFAKGEEDFLFFAKVMIFEELVDVYNIRMSTDDSMEATARKINLIHHLEEARHLVFGRQISEYLFNKYAGTWEKEVLQNVKQYLSDYIVATWKEYYNPDVYKDFAGSSSASDSCSEPGVVNSAFESQYDLVDLAWSSEVQRKHRKDVSAKVIKFLKEQDMISEEPQL